MPSPLKSDNPPRLWAVLPCAGTGSRAGGQGPKQYQSVAGEPMVLHTLRAFAQVQRLAGTVLVVSPGDDFWGPLPSAAPEANASAAAAPQAGSAPGDGHVRVPSPQVGMPLHLGAGQLCAGGGAHVMDRGGATRAQSVFNGLQALLDQGVNPSDWVLVHDAARCLVTADMINQLIDCCLDDEVGGLLALRLPDTLKASREGRVTATVDRSDKWLAQTPQMFRLGMLVRALERAGDAVTDESSAMEAMGLAPQLVEGSAQNFKVTYPQDFALAEAVLQTRRA